MAKDVLAPSRAKVPNGEVADRLRAAVARLGRSLRLTHADGNLSPSQREVLFTITRRGPMRLSELAVTEGLNPTMVSRIVSHLESARLVTRSADGTDARVVHLESTDAGRALCQEMRNERTDALLFAIEQLSPQQRRDLTELLPTLESLVEALRSRES
jgi:DNA-binding MarR family transcriptional regulator